MTCLMVYHEAHQNIKKNTSRKEVKFNAIPILQKCKKYLHHLKSLFLKDSKSLKSPTVSPLSDFVIFFLPTVIDAFLINNGYALYPFIHLKITR